MATIDTYTPNARTIVKQFLEKQRLGGTHYHEIGQLHCDRVFHSMSTTLGKLLFNGLKKSLAECLTPDAPSTAISNTASDVLHLTPVLQIFQTLFEGYPFASVFSLGTGDKKNQIKAEVIGAMLIDAINRVAPALLEAHARGLVGPISVPGLEFRRDVLSRPNVRGADQFGPVFVVGLARTGTTVMHKLLSLDPAARAPTNAEFYTPSALWTSAQRRMYVENRHTSGMKMFDHDEPAEDSRLFEGAGGPPGVMMQTSIRGMIAAHNWYLWERNNVDMWCLHRVMVRLLEVQNAARPFEHWVFKEPMHLIRQLDAIVRVYPNARFVWTHRNIEQMMCSFLEAGTDMAGEAVRSFALMLKRGMKFRTTGSYEGVGSASEESRFQDFCMTDLLHDPEAELERLYVGWGKSFGDAHRDAVRSWVRASLREPKRYPIDAWTKSQVHKCRLMLTSYLVRFPAMSSLFKVHKNDLVPCSPEESEVADGD